MRPLLLFALVLPQLAEAQAPPRLPPRIERPEREAERDTRNEVARPLIDPETAVTRAVSTGRLVGPKPAPVSPIGRQVDPFSPYPVIRPLRTAPVGVPARSPWTQPPAPPSQSLSGLRTQACDIHNAVNLGTPMGAGACHLRNHYLEVTATMNGRGGTYTKTVGECGTCGAKYEETTGPSYRAVKIGTSPARIQGKLLDPAAAARAGGEAKVRFNALRPSLSK